MSMTTRHLWRVLVSAAALAVLSILAACGDDAEPETAVTESDTNTADVADAADGGVSDSDVVDVDPADGGVSDSDVVDVDPADRDERVVEIDPPPEGPLVTLEGPRPFGELEITDFRRVGDQVTLDFVIVSDYADLSGPFEDRFSDPADHGGEQRYSSSGVTLVDDLNQKRHLVLRDSRGTCLCTDFGAVNIPGRNRRYPGSVQFPAPPEGVEAMTVDFPHFPAVHLPLRTAG